MTADRRAARRVIHTFALAAAALALLAASASARTVHSFGGGPAGPQAGAAAAGFERLLPAADAPSGVDRIEGQQVGPFLTSSGASLVVSSALGSPAIAKDAAQGFTLDPNGRALRIAPAWVSAAAPAPGMVDRSAAVYPSVAPATDVLVRPTAAGIATYLQVTDRLARNSYEWTVALRAGETLCELDDGSVAVVAGDCGSAKAGPERRDGVANADWLADARSQYDRAKASHANAAARVGGDVVAVFHPPAAQDANGTAVATSLRAHGAVVSLAIRHNHGLTTYPAVAALEVSYPDAWKRGWTDVDGIGPAQSTGGGLVRALLPSGKTLTTHGPDPADTESLEDDPAREWDESGDGESPQGDPGDRAGDSGTPNDQDSDETIDPAEDEPEDHNGNAPIGGSGPPFVCGDAHEPRLTLVYAGASAGGLTPAVERRIRLILTQMNDKLYGESVASGGRTSPARFRVSCLEKGVAEVKAVTSTSGDVVQVIQDAIDQGVNDPDSKYLIFSDTAKDQECGIGDTLVDDELSERNASNGPSVLNPSETVEGGWAVLWGRSCWDVDTAMHENGHTMGAVQVTAPGSNGLFENDPDEPLLHCSDGYDVMCYQEARNEAGDPAPYTAGDCAIGNRGFRYDCHYDSYFDASPEEGEYLATHWNIGSRVNLFLSYAKPRPFSEPYVFLGGNGDDVAGIHRAADGAHQKPTPILNVAGGVDGNTASNPALAPDGKRVAFAGDGSSPQCNDIRTMSLEGGPARTVFDCSQNFFISAGNPEFMSDGRMAFDWAGDIYWVKTDGSDVRHIIDWDGGQSEPTYSGGGRLMAFTSTHSADGDDFGFDPQVGPRTAIFIASRHGNAPVQMTAVDDFTRAEQPKFSHDGSSIAFFGVRAGQTEGHVYVARIGGTGLTRLSTGAGGSNPEWTPTGRVVYSQVQSEMDTSITSLVKVDPGDGSSVPLVDDLAFVGAPAFRQASYPVPGEQDPALYETPEYAPID